MSVHVFMGMSLPQEEAMKVLPAIYHPPIRRGDIPQLPEDVTLVGIIDGVFLSESSVGHREILTLIKKGITVVGGGSMGALRAMELEDAGMIGVGRIFKMYRDGVIEGDDEVALVFDPDDLTALSEPLVNMRHFLAEAVRRGVIGQEEADMIIAEMKSLYYPRRSYHELLKSASKIVDEVTLLALKKMLDSESFDLKRMDALEVLNTLKRLHHSSGKGRKKPI
ncbi:MAG: TfuA-like protein [Methanomassiliicoccales archaeon PtaU1.Bin124]|nr:MAG: TfuA-like protein [Methanomassiliicoccales archaeon PtaU1.Bin124]